MQTYPDPGKQIVGFFMTPISQDKKTELTKLQMPI